WHCTGRSDIGEKAISGTAHYGRAGRNPKARTAGFRNRPHTDVGVHDNGTILQLHPCNVHKLRIPFPRSHVEQTRSGRHGVILNEGPGQLPNKPGLRRTHAIAATPWRRCQLEYRKHWIVVATRSFVEAIPDPSPNSLDAFRPRCVEPCKN